MHHHHVLHVGHAGRARVGFGRGWPDVARIELAEVARVDDVIRKQLHGEAAVFDLPPGSLHVAPIAADVHERQGHDGEHDQPERDADHQLDQRESARRA